MTDSPYLLVGLGNPGAQYEQTRHNIGFMALDHYADRIGCEPVQEKFDGLYCRIRLQTGPLVLLKPQTFMNRSGQCVAAFMKFFKIPVEKILVLHDDLDLAPARVKVVARGGAGGHNGIRSLIQHLGTTEFSRVKIGIGRPDRDGQTVGIPVERYVLARFTAEERESFGPLFNLTSEAVELFLDHGIDGCMNRINGR